MTYAAFLWCFAARPLAMGTDRSTAQGIITLKGHKSRRQKSRFIIASVDADLKLPGEIPGGLADFPGVFAKILNQAVAALWRTRHAGIAAMQYQPVMRVLQELLGH